MVVYWMTFGAIFAAFVLIWHNFVNLKAHDEGTELMIERAAIIRSGARTFLRRQDRAILVTVGLIGLGYMVMYGVMAGVSLWLGSALSRSAVEIGMRGGTYGNVRTTNAARVTNAISRTIRIALLGGSLSGFTVPAFGLFGFLIVFLLSGGARTDVVCSGLIPGVVHNAVTIRLTAYSLGCSLVAMFNRVAGGTYTKSADIAADKTGKNNHNLAEDDPRNVCSIADLIGDCVNDIAGNVSDLLESFVATPLACILIAMQNFGDDQALLVAACMYPFVLAGSGLISTLSSVMYVVLKNRKRYKWVEMTEREFLAKYPDEDAWPKTHKTKDGMYDVWTEYSLELEDPGAELNKATFISAAVVIVAGLYGAHALFSGIALPASFKWGWASTWGAATLGIVSSVGVSWITSYYTDTKHKPVQDLARLTTEGEASVVSGGVALGAKSVFPTVLIIGLSMFLASRLCGIFGIAISGVGMLSFVGTTVSIDAFGPIADNAGGLAEGCGLPEDVRAITDELDAVGNTTAAIGKGNAIGAAACAVVPLIMAYLGSFPMPDFTDFMVWASLAVGAVIGGGIIQLFIGLLTQNTNLAANKLADEAERQFQIPGVMEGTRLPDYNEAIELAADNALRYMLVPSILSFAAPIVLGFPLGPEIVLGVLIGATAVAVEEAVKNSNAGGAKDNGKKLIEMGWLNEQNGLPRDASGPDSFGKGSAAHKAAVVGDTTGDIEKDVVAVCLDISIKTMSTVSNSLAMMFYTFRIF